MITDKDSRPTLVVTTPDNYLVQVGDPTCSTKKELFDYIQKGYSVKTVPFKEYKEMNLQWIWDKPKP